MCGIAGIIETAAVENTGAVKRIVTAMDHGGPDCRKALLCEPGSVDSLVNILRRLFDDSRLRQQLSKQTRKTAITYFYCHILAKDFANSLREPTYTSTSPFDV